MAEKKPSIEDNARRLKILMIEKGIKSKELAELNKKSPQYISSLCNVESMAERQQELIEFLEAYKQK